MVTTLNAQKRLLGYRPIFVKKKPELPQRDTRAFIQAFLDYSTKRLTSLNAAEINVRKRPASPPLTAR